ncbi:MAG: hypothetical protein JW867_07645 [Candidatus Omnitrophica bacterium]|nr:hypothetical protein [Candidatus Omnitrophota bacterium]
MIGYFKTHVFLTIIVLSFFIFAGFSKLLFAQEQVQDKEPQKLEQEPSGPGNLQAVAKQPEKKEREIIGMEGKISLDLRDIDIIEALKFLSMKSGENIITTKTVTGRVTLRVEDVLVKDIFDVMLRSNGLAYEKRENIYSVMTEEEYSQLYGKAFSDVREVRIFSIDYAIPEQVFNLCDTLKSDIGRVLVSPDSGSVMIMDSPEKIKQIEAAVKSFEKKNVVRVFNLNYAVAADVAEQLKSQLEAKNAGQIRADERTNQVVVQTLPKRMEEIEKIIIKLDRKTREVLIESKVIKVKLGKDITQEVEWEGLFEAVRNSHGLTYVGSTPFAAVQASADPWRSRYAVLNGGIAADGVTEVIGLDNVGAYPFSGTSTDLSSSVPKIGLGEMHVGTVGAHDIDFTLRLLENIGETEIISTPRITIANNQEAKLHVGEKQAYVTSTTTTGQTTSTVSEDVTFVDVGLQLSITPTINEEGFVTLKVLTEISNVVSVLITPTQNRIPIIDTSMAETTVMSKSGTSIVIGGLRQNVKTLTQSKTPFLGDIPFLGKIFSSKKPSTSRTELLVLITPTIVSGEYLAGSTGRPIGETGIKGGKSYEGIPDESKPYDGKSTSDIGAIKGFKSHK